MEVEAVVDTGFSGSLSLSASLIVQLKLPFVRRGRVFLADGNEVLFDVFEATVILDAEERRITVDEANIEPVAGMNLLYGKTLTIQIVDGGAVWIRSLADDSNA